MPKTRADSSLVRAVLSAPYPLPNLITRLPIIDADLRVQSDSIGKMTRSIPLPSLTNLSQSQFVSSSPSTPLDLQDVQLLQPNLTQATETILREPRSRSRVHKTLSEAEEVELMSGIEDGIGRLGRRLNYRTEEDQATPKATRFPVNTPSTPRNHVAQSTQVQNTQHWPTPSSIGRDSLQPMSKPAPAHRGFYPTPSSSQSRGRVLATVLDEAEESSSASSGWGDSSTDGEADEERTISLRSPKVSHFPSSPHRKNRKVKPTIEKPLFIGQTNLSPFTFFPNSKRPPTVTLSAPNGYLSDATSVQTAVPLKKGRFRDGPISRKLDFKSPAQRVLRAPRFLSTKPGPIIPLMTPQITPVYQKPAVQLQTRIFNPPNNTAPPRYLEVTTPPAPSVLPFAQLKRQSFSNPPIPDSPFPTPVPMSIDPRSSAEGYRASWPHPLNPGEVFRPRGQGTFASGVGGSGSLMDICEESDIGESNGAGVGYQVGPQGWGSTSQPFDTQEPQGWLPPSNPGPSSSTTNSRTAEIPLAKACHNFLLARRIQAARRRKLTRERQRKVEEGEKMKLFGGLQRGLGVLSVGPASASRPESKQATSESVTTSGNQLMNGITRHTVPIRAISSIARVDESKPPRKRPRSLSPSSAFDVGLQTRPPLSASPSGPIYNRITQSPHSTRISSGASRTSGLTSQNKGRSVLLPPASIIKPPRTSDPSGRDLEEEEADIRRDEWLIGERRRLLEAQASFSQAAPSTALLDVPNDDRRKEQRRNNFVNPVDSPNRRVDKNGKQRGQMAVKGRFRAVERSKNEMERDQEERQSSAEAGLGGFALVQSRSFLEARRAKGRGKGKGGSVSRW